MPRRPRVIIEGGLYHVYNRFARGEEIFSDPEEAIEFLELLRTLKQRDDFIVYAWCLMSNHYHLAVRTSAVPFSRTMRTLQGGYSRAFNRRWRRTGPLWQTRYQARLVDDQRYFDQLLIYIHLNPVRAGVVKDPRDHVFCGHRELMKKVRTPLVDVDETLLGFGTTVKNARRTYLKRLNAALAAEERAKVPVRMPWWTKDRDIELSPGRSYVDELGRSTGLPREKLEGVVFLELACQGLGITVDVLASPRKDRETTRFRLLIASVAVERWSQRAGVLGPLLGKHPDVVSRWVRMGADRRRIEEDFAEATDHLDRYVFELSSSDDSSP